MKNYCINCSTEQQYVGEIKGYYYCERCGSKIHADGSVSYDGSREGTNDMNKRIEDFNKKNWKRYE